MKDEKVDTTLMMVIFNRLNLTKKTFETTLSNAGKKYNIVIVDNCSSDDSIKWIEDNILNYNLIDQYRIVKLDKNMGIAYGRNMCLKTCIDELPTEFLSTIDNDVELPNNWLVECCSILKANNKIAACGVNLEGRRYNKAFVKVNGLPIEIQIKPKGNLGTAATVFTYDIFEKIGYFCSDLKIYAHEDADFFFRARMIKPMLAYLSRDGIHLGIGEEDTGEYREMKNKYWKLNMPIYNNNIRRYLSGEKNIFIGFKP